MFMLMMLLEVDCFNYSVSAVKWTLNYAKVQA